MKQEPQSYETSAMLRIELISDWSITDWIVTAVILLRSLEQAPVTSGALEAICSTTTTPWHILHSGEAGSVQ